MTEVTQTSDLRKRCEALPYKYGVDYTAVWDSTMARFWLSTEEARQAITALLNESPEGSIVGEEQLREWRCDFPDQRYGELFYLLQPGVLFVPSFLNMSLVPGMHGYSPDDKDSAASWLTNFETNPPVDRLEDIFAVMQAAADS
jgi:hypothetical protein